MAHSPERATRSINRGQQLVLRALGQQLRMPPTYSPRRQRIRRQTADRVPEQSAVADGAGRQPGDVQCRAQNHVHADSGQLQIEALQAGGGSAQSGLTVRTLAEPPRLAERQPHLGADQAHVALQVAHHHSVEAQAFALQPAQVIH
ncbi:hypothetical protein ADL21_03170 [Streptomyces albus subsp. albus]|nr:hypothetical protein ADL21_03170 [Streptomyces albus subsp. albus]